MFPAARNAHRRLNTNESKKIPIPIAVTLHNLMADSTVSVAGTKSKTHEQEEFEEVVGVGTSSTTSSSKWFRPDHNRSLVPKVRLEIITDGSRVVYSSESEIQSIHPSWEHIDERIDLPGEWWLSEGNLYKSMKLRFIILDNIHLEVPLYPSKLERLDGSHPEALPPNSCFVYFSDGSTRLPSNIFQILLESQMAEPPPIEDFSRFEDDAFSVLDSVPQDKFGNRDRAVSASSLLGEATQFTPIKQALFAEPASPDSSEVPFGETESDAILKDSEAEREFLMAMIAKEEALMEKELADLQEDKISLESLLNEAKAVEQDIQLVQTEIKQQEIQLHRDRFLKDAQCVKLMKELRTVYPLTLDPQKGYLIRKLRLPVDIYTTNVPEDEMSAALGFTCHLIFMASKYLSVSLRYRIFCNSSRSVIQHDGILYPLFLARPVDRDQLERGITLLGANVDCMLLTYRVSFTPKSHILARLQRLFDEFVDGGETDNGIK